MNPRELIRQFGIKNLYHFTDVRNINSIKQHGLLSWRELQARGIIPPAPGANELSHDLDVALDLDQYVHLCLWSEHPMEWRARQDGRILQSTFLKISTEVLNLPGLLFAADVANKTGVELLDFDAAVQMLDFEAVYRYLDWKDPEVKARVQASRRYEVLVPDRVPAQMISGFP